MCVCLSACVFACTAIDARGGGRTSWVKIRERPPEADNYPAQRFGNVGLAVQPLGVKYPVFRFDFLYLLELPYKLII